MAILLSKHAAGTIASPVPAGAELVVCRASYTLTADVAANDLIQMMNLPANAVPVDLILDTDDLDSGATGTVTVALANAGLTDIDTTASGGAGWLTAQSIQAATGVRADAAGLRAMSRCAASATANRPVVIKIVGETAAAAGAVIGLTLTYRAA
jgi:hypothetical protein